MEIIVLAENEATGTPGLIAEHGLSLLVIAAGKRVLFDTGATGALVANARALGLGEALARIDAIVLSHGHHDHAGGLAAVLEHTRRPIPVHIRPGFFAPRVSMRTGLARAIGVPFERAHLEACGARFVQEDAPREVLPGFWLTGEIPLREETDAGEADLRLGPPGAAPTLARDQFTDEQALAVEGQHGLAVLMGCSHRGVLNSVLAAKAAAREQAVHIAIGGAHLRSATAGHIDWASRRMHQLASHAALGHCTGKEAERRFAEVFQDQFHPLRAGWRFEDTLPG